MIVDGVKIADEKHLRDICKLDLEGVALIEQGYAKLSAGEVEMPEIQHLSIVENRGDIDIKSAFIHGSKNVAVKIAAGYDDNPKRNLPFSSGSVVVVDALTGRCKAVLLDNCYLTNLRTALAGAVAAKHFAPQQHVRLGVVGTGVQARLQAQAVALVRDVESVMVFGRSEDAIRNYQQEMSEELSVAVSGTTQIEPLMEDCNTIVTTTPATSPLIRFEMLRSGHHITAMGSDLPGKNEIDAGCFERADRISCDDLEASSKFGELQWLSAEKRGSLNPTPLGRVVGNPELSRADDNEITICDLVGLGVQDAAIANYVCSKLDI
ncbi:MAG: ornithine cyclodeaminase family protein [Pseudomonadota bacterium]